MKLAPALYLCFVTAASGLASPLLLADDKVIREYSFDVSQLAQIDILANVGSITIVPANGSEIKLVLEIEGKKQGWLQRSKDVSAVELDSRVRGDRLILEQTEEDTETHWTIRLPAVEHTRIKLGVGAIKAELAATELEVKLGVGEVSIEYPKAAAGLIDLHVGVGEASLQGTREVSAKRAFVSHAINGSGEGDKDIGIEVGVGNAALRLL